MATVFKDLTCEYCSAYSAMSACAWCARGTCSVSGGSRDDDSCSECGADDDARRPLSDRERRIVSPAGPAYEEMLIGLAETIK